MQVLPGHPLADLHLAVTTRSCVFNSTVGGTKVQALGTADARGPPPLPPAPATGARHRRAPQHSRHSRHSTAGTAAEQAAAGQASGGCVQPDPGAGRGGALTQGLRQRERGGDGTAAPGAVMRGSCHNMPGPGLALTGRPVRPCPSCCLQRASWPSAWRRLQHRGHASRQSSTAGERSGSGPGV